MSRIVVLVGVGGIGFRHFQALFNCKNDIDIYVVDVNKNAIDKAKKYGASIDSSKGVYYIEDIDNAPKEIDVAIIATSSLPRRAIFEKMIENHIVKNIIFEKFLFPKLEDYKFVEELLIEKSIRAYVDCPARIYNIYNDIKKECKDSSVFKAIFKGSNWGLACNAIHLIDQVSYISGADTNKIVCTGVLENEIVDSKRAGYKEFYGKIVGSIGEGVAFTIECDHRDNPLVFECFTDKAYYYVNEADRVFTKVLLDESHEVITSSIEIPYVSQITNLNVDSILEDKQVFLPTYKESRPLHESLLKMFLLQMNNIENNNVDLCPIT